MTAKLDSRKKLFSRYFERTDCTNGFKCLKEAIGRYQEVRMVLGDCRWSYTDLSQKGQLTLCIRWVDDDMEIHEDQVELIHVPKTDATTLTHTIKDSLVRLCLPLLCCRGQAYNGAANMSGHLAEGCAICSVCSLLRSLHNPLFTGCWSCLCSSSKCSWLSNGTVPVNQILTFNTVC